MSYKNKVFGACKQDEDLLGEKFRYNREDDIVLLFNEGKPDTAYCYKRTDLSRLLKNGYRSDNSTFSYIVIPHTNQYIVNPEEIIGKKWHSFILKKVRDREKYRRDYPETLYFVEKGTDLDFELPPKIGDEIREEKVEMVPSEVYLDTERKMREIRERRENRASLETERKMREIRERRGERAREEEPSVSAISNDPDMINMFNDYKDFYDRWKTRFIQFRRKLLRPAVLQRLLYRNEDGEMPPIVRTERFSDNPPSEDPNLVWINESFTLTGLKMITWFRGREKHRENKPAQIIFSGDDNNVRNVILSWYRDGELDNDSKPILFNTRGIIEWKNPNEHIKINFRKKIIEDHSEDYFLVSIYNFNRGLFEGIETRGSITYYGEEYPIEIRYIPL